MKSSSSGITLIALVISIIVMLILAGVSINALVGDNGVLTQTQYASFLNEMSAVEEAVQIYKAGKTIEGMGAETNAIPTNGMCSFTEIQSTERLVGEVGYFRTWSIGGVRPAIDIESAPEFFNDEFETELIPYPAGVQDLFYLNNDLIGINGNKRYLIDASTGMIYSMTGIGIKGTRVYSIAMAKAVMNGDKTAPLFAEAEVSGAGGGQLAGNVTTEYVDASGNPVYKKLDGTFIDANGNAVDPADVKENTENYNPYGFKILASPNSNNIFKLYNNGDLYGKGIKGIQLNSSQEEMDKINAYVWQEFNVPDNIISYAGGVNKIINGKSDNIFFIDKQGYLWAMGNNTNNMFGLTAEEVKEYTGRLPIKLNVAGKKVYNVIAESGHCFVICEDNTLYVCGRNESGELGLGHKNNVTQFTQNADISNPKAIVDFNFSSHQDGYNSILVKCNDGRFYFCGNDTFGELGTGYAGSRCDKFTRVFDGNIGPDIDQDIKDIMYGCNCVVLKKDGTVWESGYSGYLGSSSHLGSGSASTFRQFDNLQNIESMFCCAHYDIMFIERLADNSKKLWCATVGTYCFGTDSVAVGPNEYPLKDDLKNEGIKELMPLTDRRGIYALSNSGKLYFCGNNSSTGLNKSSGQTANFVYTGLDNISTLNSSLIQNNVTYGIAALIVEKDGKLYSTGNASIIFGDNILQKNWKLIANNVLYFDAKSCAYIDKNYDLYVAGEDSMCLGLGNDSLTSKKIPNYRKVTDSNISGKAVKVGMCSGSTFVVTTDKKLYGAGISNSLTDGAYLYPGWSADQNDNRTEYTLIMEDVDFFTVKYVDDYRTKFAIKTNGETYVWGTDYYTTGSGGTSSNALPTKINIPTVFGGYSNIEKWIMRDSFRSFVITKTHKVYMTGSWYHMYAGGNTASTTVVEYTKGLNFATDEYVIDVAPCTTQTVIFLTNKGRLFGYGSEQYLGINRESSNNVETMELTGISDVVQITCGAGFFIAVKSDGTVWGTGTNTYGVLGRWVGVGRGESNSRYKTAINWVECPELEI